MHQMEEPELIRNNRHTYNSIRLQLIVRSYTEKNILDMLLAD